MAFTTYCQYVASPGAKDIHVQYHNNEYGFPQTDDNVLFERLILEINQAGLSWETILNKRKGFQNAFHGFDVYKVASYNELDRDRLLADPSIIRNRLKVGAAIHNANVVVDLIQQHGSFVSWLDANHPLSKDEWVKLFKSKFKFVGGEIVNEFLMSLGYLPGTHEESCPVYHLITKLNPPWMRA